MSSPPHGTGSVSPPARETLPAQGMRYVVAGPGIPSPRK
jgi:hypothetical protein